MRCGHFSGGCPRMPCEAEQLCEPPLISLRTVNRADGNSHFLRAYLKFDSLTPSFLQLLDNFTNLLSAARDIATEKSVFPDMSSCPSCSSHSQVAPLGHPDFSICVDDEDSQQYYRQQNIEQISKCVESEFVSGVRKTSRKRDCLNKMVRILCEAISYGSAVTSAFIMERYRIHRVGQLGIYLEIEERKSGIWINSRRQIERVLHYYQLQSESMGRGRQISKMERTGCGTSVTTAMVSFPRSIKKHY